MAQAEEMAGELDTYQLLYWELRELVDDIRVRLNVGDGVSDREVLALIPVVPRQLVVVLPGGMVASGAPMTPTAEEAQTAKLN